MPWPCNYCGRDSDDVSYMIKGPYDYQICSECVQLCVEIIQENDFHIMKRMGWSELDMQQEIVQTDLYCD